MWYIAIRFWVPEIKFHVISLFRLFCLYLYINFPIFFFLSKATFVQPRFHGKSKEKLGLFPRWKYSTFGAAAFLQRKAQKWAKFFTIPRKGVSDVGLEDFFPPRKRKTYGTGFPHTIHKRALEVNHFNSNGTFVWPNGKLVPQKTFSAFCKKLSPTLLETFFLRNCNKLVHFSTFPCKKVAAPNMKFSSLGKTAFTFYTFSMEKWLHKHALK